MLFVSHLCIDVVYSFAVNLLVVTLQKKLSPVSHKLPLTENRTVGVPHVTTWGGGGGRRTSLLLPQGTEKPSYAVV